MIVFSSRLRDNAIDGAFGLAFALLASLVFVQPAWAYVDPSVMTYTIQALAGVAVALSAVAGVALRRTRKVLMKWLNIDENANKDVEGVVHRINVETKQPVPNNSDPIEAERLAKAAKRKNKPGVLGWPLRFGLALLASFFLMFTLFMVAPYELVATNGKDLLFHLNDIWAPMAIFAVVLSLVLGFAVSFIRGKAFDVAFGLITALGFASWVEAMFLNSKLPIADGAFLYWPDFTDMFIISSIVWIAIIVAVIVLMLTKRNAGRIACGFACFALIIMQTVGIASLSFAPPEKGPHEFWDGNYTTQEGLYDLNAKSNVVVFVLDMFDCKDLVRIQNEHPETLNEMTGFTAYTDSVGSFVPTRYGVPFLLTGEFPREDDTWKDFVENRYDRSSFIKDIYNAGFSVGLYTTNIENGTDAVAPYAMNIHHLDKKDDPNAKIKQIDNWGVIRSMVKCALYRDLPWVLKPPFWFYTDEINDDMSIKPEPGRTGKDYSVLPFRINDIEYLQNLKADHLELNDQGANGAFKFIHMEGAHWPYTMDENGNRANTDIQHQSRGALRVVSEYLRQMKELGVYDSSTVIITSDHGVWEWGDNNSSMSEKGSISITTAPFLMIKPAGASDAPCTFSKAQTGHLDYPATVMEAVGGDASKYGITAFEAPEAGRIRTTYITEFDGHHDLNIHQYSVNGPVMDIDSWSPTGKTYDCDGTIYRADQNPGNP